MFSKFNNYLQLAAIDDDLSFEVAELNDRPDLVEQLDEMRTNLFVYSQQNTPPRPISNDHPDTMQTFETTFLRLDRYAADDSLDDENWSESEMFDTHYNGSADTSNCAGSEGMSEIDCEEHSP